MDFDLFAQSKDFYMTLAGASSLLLLIILFLVVPRGRSSKKKKSSELKPLFVPKEKFAKSIKNLFLGTDKRIDEIIPELEEILLTADVGVSATERLIKRVLANQDIETHEEAFDYLKQEIKKLLTPKTKFHIDKNQNPYVIYLVGVNGVGKTTTIGKLANQFKEQGHKVLLVAADTFRAAAVDQLRVWSERNQVDFIGGDDNADPSSVIVDGLRKAKAKGLNVVLVDTAGRLQTKKNLMTELQKMVRMSEKELGHPPNEIFLIVDAITGQNGFSQAQIFLEAVPLTGVILTKYDATSKGGIILSIVEQTDLPIRYLGMGEGIQDLKEFEASIFVQKLFD